MDTPEFRFLYIYSCARAPGARAVHTRTRSGLESPGGRGFPHVVASVESATGEVESAAVVEVGEPTEVGASLVVATSTSSLGFIAARRPPRDGLRGL